MSKKQSRTAERVSAIPDWELGEGLTTPCLTEPKSHELRRMAADWRKVILERRGT